MPRYDDQPEYNRPRDNIRRNDGRDVRRAVEPAERRAPPVMERDYHMDDSMDMRMDNRQEPRANTGTRVERPPVRADPRAEREILYRDPRTGELYRDPTSRRTPYEHEFDDMQPSSRPIVVSAPEPGQPRASYAEYFLPGEGIEREVIQAEICRYLGQDATCKPGQNPQDGRQGFIIKAYRALTTEMIRSLQESSAKFRNEDKYFDKEKRRRPQVSYTPIQDHQYDRDVDMDDEDRSYAQPDRYGRPMDPRDMRPSMAGRHVPPVTSAYISEPGYPAYSLAAAQSSVPQMGFEPRTFASAGNTTPPTGMRGPGFPSSDFPSRTAQQSNAPPPAPTYMDPRTGKMVSSQHASYPSDSRYRR